MNSPRTTLYRDKQNAKLLGVCSGIADYTGVNVLWVRLAFIILLITVAPILPVPDWEGAYAGLIRAAADALAGVPDLDLTAELITHRFTPGSKAVLRGWYPGSDLPLDEAERVEKRTKFGSVKHVFPKPLMQAMRAHLTACLARDLPAARILYWT